jgi:hypothetical protein
VLNQDRAAVRVGKLEVAGVAVGHAVEVARYFSVKKMKKNVSKFEKKFFRLC